ncbi:MAG: outer membrane beta-barrel protein [Bacteroidales bacterium]|jgi:hypothetical protein
MKSLLYTIRRGHGVATFLFLLISSGLFGQSKIKILIVDSVSNKGVEFAAATLTQFGQSRVFKYDESDSTGKAEILNVPYGKYILNINHLNYRSFRKEITVNKETHDIGRVRVREKLTSMQSVTITGLANPIVVKQDTIEFTAAAFPVAEGDVLEQLLRKMPGLEMDSKGKFSYNGKAINKIMVDGKDFFANDSKTLTSNLPARIVDKVKVIDQKTEQAKFTGVDDGTRETVMDVTLKEGFKNGLFGNATGGYGTQDTYTANLFTARFDKNTNFGLVGSSSNTPGFGGGMVMDSGGQEVIYFMSDNGGKTTTSNIGLNGNTEFNKGKLKLGGGYTYFDSETETHTNRTRQTFLEDSSFIYNQLSTGKSENKTDRFSASLDWKPNKKLQVLFRPSLDRTRSSSLNRSDYTTNGVSGVPVNEGSSSNYSNGESMNLGGFLILMYAFDKPRRSLSINSNFGLISSNMDGFNQSTTTKYDNNSTTIDSVRQKSNTITDNYNASARVSYTEPLSSKYTMELSYYLQYGYRISDKNTYNWNALTESYDSRDAVYSNDFQDISLNQNIGLNIHRMEKKYSYSLGFSLQPSYTKSTGTNRDYTNSVINYAPTLSMHYTLNKTTYLRFSYRGSSTQPSISQREPVPDNSNPLYIKIGNPRLLPGFNNNLTLSLNGGNREKYRMFDISVDGNYRTNSFSNITAYGTGGVQYSVPVNTDPIYSGSIRLMYNTPLFTKKFSMNITSSANYNNNLSYTAKIEADPQADPRDVTIDNFKNIVANTTNTLVIRNGLRFTYKFNKADFSLGSNLSYRDTWYSIANKSKPEMWNYSASANLNLRLPYDFTMNAGMEFSVSKGYGGDKDKPFTIFNADINKGLCKNKLALKLRLYDILNQARGIRRTTTENYIEDTEFYIQKQYFMLTLSYKFGKFPGNSRGMRGNANSIIYENGRGEIFVR